MKHPLSTDLSQLSEWMPHESRTSISTRFSSIVLPLLLLSAPALAQDSDDTIEEVVVRAHHALSADGWAQPAEALAGEELNDKIADSIGATLGNEPGIHTTSFGPAVGRPVIHGLDGVRVRVMEDDIDTLDVSTSSGDHAVSVDPFIAESIDIFKGVATLLYGPGAIGGVVDVHTGRVPDAAPEQLTGKLDIRGADNGDARRGAFRIDGGNDTFAWHLDGTLRDADDIEIPGFVESARWRAREDMDHDEDHDDDDDHEGEDHEDEDHEDGDGDHEDEEEVAGVLPGSYLETKSGAFGVSMIGERGFLGLSVSRFESEYGIPGHSHAHDDDEHHDDEEEGHDDDHDDEEGEDHDEDADSHDEEEGLPFIDLTQTRIALEGNLNDPLPGFRNLNVRFGINDYEHVEVEPSGEIGTRFVNDAWEGRAELRHDPIGGFDGVLGAQFGHRRFAAYGEESLSPPNDTTTLGLFWVGQKLFDNLQLETGLRFDQVRHEPDGLAEQSFRGGSASIGAVMPFTDNWTATLLFDYANRAPVSEELFSNGPHAATNSFDIGDPTLDTETALSFSGTLGYTSGKWSALATAYFVTFEDFIHQRDTGMEMEDLPVRQFVQADASFTGFEIEASFVAAEWDNGRLSINSFYDAVSAEIDTAEIDTAGNDNPPRLPPHRFGFGTELDNRSFSASMHYMRVFEQNDVASYELPTDAYNDLRAQLAWNVETSQAKVKLFIQGRNLTDAEQRHHTSFVKDLAPAPGRTLEAGLRVAF